MIKSKKYGICLIFCLLVPLGCGPEEPPVSESPSELQTELSGNYGEVLFTYSQALGDRTEEPFTSFQMSARFVRVRDIGRQEIRHLWGEELPLTTAPRGRCHETSGSVRPPLDYVLGGSLELLDAGAMTLRVANEEYRVPDWNFPSVYGVMAGVLYGGEELEIEYHPDQSYSLQVTGSEEIDPFEVTLVAPDTFDGLTIGGTEVGVEPIVPEEGRPLELRWIAGQAQSEVVIELSYASYHREQRIICRSQDDGIEEIPASTMSRLFEHGVTDARLTISRTLGNTFNAEGLDDAEALFIVEMIVPLVL